MDLRKEGKVLTNLVAHFIHYGVVIFIISFIIVSVAMDDRKFFYPQTQIEIDGGGISPKASSDIVGKGYSYGNLCTADTAWNTKHVREHLILWLRSLSALPHVKGTLHLPLDNELQNILVLQYYNQVSMNSSINCNRCWILLNFVLCRLSLSFKLSQGLPLEPLLGQLGLAVEQPRKQNL